MSKNMNVFVRVVLEVLGSRLHQKAFRAHRCEDPLSR